MFSRLNRKIWHVSAGSIAWLAFPQPLREILYNPWIIQNRLLKHELDISFCLVVIILRFVLISWKYWTKPSRSAFQVKILVLKVFFFFDSCGQERTTSVSFSSKQDWHALKTYSNSVTTLPSWSTEMSKLKCTPWSSNGYIFFFYFHFYYCVSHLKSVSSYHSPRQNWEFLEKFEQD